jgi:hypothetical protein
MSRDCSLTILEKTHLPIYRITGTFHAFSLEKRARVLARSALPQRLPSHKLGVIVLGELSKKACPLLYLRSVFAKKIIEGINR